MKRRRPYVHQPDVPPNYALARVKMQALARAGRYVRYDEVPWPYDQMLPPNAEGFTPDQFKALCAGLLMKG